MPAGDEDTQLLKEKLVTAVTQAFASLENAETEAEHGTRVILSDTAEGLKKTLHTVRKVSYLFTIFCGLSYFGTTSLR